jgi:hypothetical protein
MIPHYQLILRVRLCRDFYVSSNRISDKISSMDNDIDEFPKTDVHVQPILEELAAREPIFHHPELGTDRASLERQITDDYWEVGASGKAYDRKFVLDTVESRLSQGTEADTSNWKTSEFYCRQLGSHTYLLTYLLDQDGRLSRRSTLWQRSGTDWQSLYHQGTLVRGDSANS